MLSIVPPIICTKCGIKYPNDQNIPMLFLENNWKNNKIDVTTDVKQFYEKTPFPDYEDIDSISSLVKKAERGIFYTTFYLRLELLNLDIMKGVYS